jgi:CubicO group peptidase (beta-lactamase class C family)
MCANPRQTNPGTACLTILAIVLLLNVAVGHAQCGDQSPAPLDAKDLEIFLDKFFPEQMNNKLHFPGAVFVLVKDGRVCFAKGYGYADLQNKERVSPDRTGFRVGSVSKLFTATA